MGWTFRRGASKETIIHDILEPWDTTATEETAKSWYGAKPAGTRTQSIVLAYRCVGNSLWYVRETTTTKPDGTVTTEKWIGLSLLDKDGSYGWGHKDMEEAMGPYDDTCPVEHGAAARWRVLREVARCDTSEVWKAGGATVSLCSADLDGDGAGRSGAIGGLLSMGKSVTISYRQSRWRDWDVQEIRFNRKFSQVWLLLRQRQVGVSR